MNMKNETLNELLKQSCSLVETLKDSLPTSLSKIAESFEPMHSTENTAKALFRQQKELAEQFETGKSFLL
jgi:hypothetical protein